MTTAMVGEGLEADTELGTMSISLSEDASSIQEVLDQPRGDQAQLVNQVQERMSSLKNL
jgi:hypothetical protein